MALEKVVNETVVNGAVGARRVSPMLLVERSGGTDAESTHYRFARGLDYVSIVAASEKVAWSVDEIFRLRSFDASKPIVPASWVRTEALDFLNEEEHRLLNHCRAFSYAHLLGNFEEFIPQHLTDVIDEDWHDERDHLRALLRFGDEEMKHQQLFARTETVLEGSCGHRFGRYFDAQKVKTIELSDALLSYPVLPRFLIVLALEWGTQRHYIESVHDRIDEKVDPLYIDILKAHWVEEAQHTKSDMLEMARLASAMGPAELSDAFDDLKAIGELVDAAFVGQAREEVETLKLVTGRRFSDTEITALQDTLHRSLSAILAGVGLSHRNFTKVALELSTEGAAKLGIV